MVCVKDCEGTVNPVSSCDGRNVCSKSFVGDDLPVDGKRGVFWQWSDGV